MESLREGFRDLTDAERAEVSALQLEIFEVLRSHSLGVSVAALINMLLSAVTMLADNEQEAREYMKSLSDTILVSMERLPGAWASMQEVRVKDAKGKPRH